MYGAGMGSLQLHVYASTVAYGYVGVTPESCDELITNASTCENAANQTGGSYEGTIEDSDYPSGCFLKYTNGVPTGDVYFNDDTSSACGTNAQTCLCKSSWSAAWSLSGNQGSAWYQSNTIIPSNVTRIRFVAVTGSSWASDMAIDAVSISSFPQVPSPQPTPLPTLGGYPDCDFASGTCSFSNTGSYSWSRGLTTPSSSTVRISLKKNFGFFSRFCHSIQTCNHTNSRPCRGPKKRTTAIISCILKRLLQIIQTYVY
jgi:hypothetical protein